MSNFWDQLMGDDEHAATYMDSYGEGPGCDTRMTISGFINDGESVLDVGCGPGWNLDHFWKYGPTVSDYIGLDYSERFIKIANRRHQGAIFFEIGDARKLKEKDKSWDVVILQDVLDHMPGYEKPITEAMRVSRKRVIISFWRGQMKSDYPNDHDEDMIRDDGNDGWTGEYSRRKFEHWLDTLGYMWMRTESGETANRWHVFYVIDKEEPK